jgi:hypothetical protein
VQQRRLMGQKNKNYTSRKTGRVDKVPIMGKPIATIVPIVGISFY